MRPSGQPLFSYARHRTCSLFVCMCTHTAYALTHCIRRLHGCLRPPPPPPPKTEWTGGAMENAWQSTHMYRERGLLRNGERMLLLLLLRMSLLLLLQQQQLVSHAFISPAEFAYYYASVMRKQGPNVTRSRSLHGA